MAPGSTRHTATTLRWLLSHGHRPRLSNKRTGVCLFVSFLRTRFHDDLGTRLFDLRAIAQLLKHCLNTRPTEPGRVREKY